MRTLAIINQKGGSGKTTTAVNLSSALGSLGKRVLVIDMDPQASATAWFGIRDPGRGITDVFIDQAPILNLIRATDVMGVALVPASAWLSGAEKVLGWDSRSLKMFGNSLSSLPEQWDFTLVDCPPTLGLLTANALIAVREVLIPVEAHTMALPGVDRVVASVETLRDHLNPNLRVTGIVACRVDPRTRHSRQVVNILRSRFGKLVYKSEIRENIRLAEAPSHGKPIILFDSSSTGARDHHALAQELIARG